MFCYEMFVLVGLLLSEVLLGGIMFLGIARGLGLPSDGLGWNCLLLLAVAVISYCLLMRFFCFGLRRCPGL